MVIFVSYFLATFLWKMLEIISVGEYESFQMGEKEKKTVDETAVANT